MRFKTSLLLCVFFLLSKSLMAASYSVPLAVWANEAIVATYTFTHQDFLKRQKEIAKYFTSEGWINYTKALQQSGLPESVKQNQYDVSAVATSPPEIKKLSEDTWQAVMPLLVIYKNPQYLQKQTLQVTILFTEVPKGQGVRGMAISSLKSKIKQPACRCPGDA